MVEKRQDNGFDGCRWGGECMSSAHPFLLGQARRQLTCIIAHCVPLHRTVLRSWPESLPKLSSVRSSAVYRSCCVVEQIGLVVLGHALAVASVGTSLCKIAPNSSTEDWGPCPRLNFYTMHCLLDTTSTPAYSSARTPMAML
jgi:hypothetical protein